MKRLLTVALLATLWQWTAQAQDITIEMQVEQPVCPASSCIYTASASSMGQDTVAMEYIWDFDNGDVLRTAEPSVRYAYRTGGAYMPRVTAVFPDGDSYSHSGRLMVGQRPSFASYANDMPPHQQGMCLGESVTLSMPVSSRDVEYIYNNVCSEKNPQSIYGGYWIGNVSLKCFDGRMISAGTLQGIALTAATDNDGDIQIVLSLPDGQDIVIKDYDAPMPEGTPVKSRLENMRRYVFSINEAALHDCPLNGDWNIKVSSRGLQNEAYVSEFEVMVNDDVLREYQWRYTQEYDLRRAVWSGKGVSATSAGVAKVTPPMEGNSKYVFLINDNLGCSHDTSVYVSVERASFSGADSTTFIGDEISFDNKTSWAKETTWSFGDKTPLEQSNPAPHAYYERNRYMVVMQCKSARGCVDVDTQFVDIVPRKLEVKEVNIFTPNGDGVNDVFTFFLEDESFLKNGGLTKMPANIRSIKGKIYNVYGQTVYKWDEVEASIFGWDGTWHNNGSRACPPGTYFYDIIVYGKDGNSLKRTGSILLVRGK